MQLWFWFDFHHDFVVTVPTVEFVLDGRLNQATLTAKTSFEWGRFDTHGARVREVGVALAFVGPLAALSSHVLSCRLAC